MTFLQFSPYKRIEDYFLPFREKFQGKPRVIIYIIYISLDSFSSWCCMPSYKIFLPDERCLKVFTIYGYGGNLDPVPFVQFLFPLSKEAPHKI